jgi:hypothetical protein
MFNDHVEHDGFQVRCARERLMVAAARCSKRSGAEFTARNTAAEGSGLSEGSRVTVGIAPN